MGISTVRKCVVLMLIIMLVVTQAESITPSQEFAAAPAPAPNKFPEPPCHVKCTRKCKVYSDNIIYFDYCMSDCISGCPVSPTV